MSDLHDLDPELQRAADDELEQLLAEGEALLEPSVAEEARASLQRLTTQELPASRRRPHTLRLVTGLAAAAALVLALVQIFTDSEGVHPPEDEPIPLGSGSLELLEPSGQVESYELFRWLGELPPGGRFVLRIFDPENAGEEPVVEVELDDNHWLPDESDRARLPRALRWEVRVVDPFGTVLEAVEGKAEREPGPPQEPPPEPSGETGALESVQELRLEEESYADEAVAEAYALHDAGEAEEAVALLEGVEAELTRAVAGRLRIRTVLASLLLPLGRFDEALTWLDRAEAGLARSGLEAHLHDPLKLGILKTRIDAAIGLGLVDRLFEQVAEEERLAEALGPDLFRVASRLHAIDVLLLTARYGRAAERCEEELAAPLWTPFARERSLLRLRHGVAHWFLSRDDPAHLRTSLESIRGFLDDPAAPEPTKLQAAARLAELHLVHGELEAARAALDEAHRRLEGLGASARALVDGPHLAALEVELALALGAEADELERLGEAMQTSYATFLERWRSTPLRPGGIGFLQYPRRRMVFCTLVHLETVLHPGDEGLRRAGERLFETQAQGTYAREHLRDHGSIGELEAALAVLTDGGGVVLAYVPGRHRTSALLFSAEGILGAELAPEPRIERPRRELQAAITGPHDTRTAARVAALAGELSELLLPESFRPVLAAAEHITVVGTDLMGYVPFELLPLEDATTIEDQTALSYLPSLPLANILAARPGTGDTPRRSLGLFYAPEYSDELRREWPSLAPLPEARKERALLLRGLSPTDVEVLSGRAATLETLRRYAPGVRTLHLVTHGVLCYERERPTSLLFAPCRDNAGLVGAREIETTAMPALVRVSACGATYAHERRGDDGLASLGGAFLRAGADVVLLSPHRLDLRDVQRMSLPFHHSLFEEGAAPAEAVRRARTSVRAGSSALAGLVHTVGLGGRPLR